MIPKRSPYGLIQEDLWPNEWRVLVACILLNRTTRKQIEKVLPRLFAEYPDANSMASADQGRLSQIIARLGFKNRRAGNLINFSKKYATKSWKHASELPGIGEYASSAWEIFFLGRISECPKDHALVKYYHWRKSHEIA
jgi:methyl-CpG-binding domain protein 4